MDKLMVRRGNPLHGEVSISGSKNAALPIMIASLLCEDVVTLENVPDIADTKNITRIMKTLDVDVEYLDEHTLRIDSRHMTNRCADCEEVRKMRASYYYLGALLGRFGSARVAFPGGCNFGVRPIDLHIKGFEALGAVVSTQSIIEMKADNLMGARIFLDFASVGATINIMLAAVKARGTTVIENAAKEPHVVDTASFLNSMGADVKGAGTDTIRIRGVRKMHGSSYAIIPDQIEAGTYMVAAAISEGEVTIRNLIPRHMESISAKLREAGVRIAQGGDWITVSGRDCRLRPTKVKTMPYPGFPTDMQPQMMALLSIIQGTSMVNESVFDDRFRYVEELKKMGAHIDVEGHIAIVEGVDRLVGTEVQATDLRAGAAMILAGLAAEGTTYITNVEYIDRGYESMVEHFRDLGADISRVSDDGPDLKLIKSVAV
ncbi:MAG: UDP-N-acetylglucosamine 1-carboxyvinyltransferase [Lachnospiraceae bacterium]|nr:UDP-N-acetylglucosamine 1-carboxyvinyltransferase [Lachnospiraceae bacterium]